MPPRTCAIGKRSTSFMPNGEVTTVSVARRVRLSKLLSSRSTKLLAVSIPMMFWLKEQSA